MDQQIILLKFSGLSHMHLYSVLRVLDSIKPIEIGIIHFCYHIAQKIDKLISIIMT